MSQAQVSFVWPMTSLGFVFTTLAAWLILHEQVVPLRWVGGLLIVIGAGLITWTEKTNSSNNSSATPPQLETKVIDQN